MPGATQKQKTSQKRGQGENTVFFEIENNPASRYPGYSNHPDRPGKIQKAIDCDSEHKANCNGYGRLSRLLKLKRLFLKLRVSTILRLQLDALLRDFRFGERAVHESTPLWIHRWLVHTISHVIAGQIREATVALESNHHVLVHWGQSEITAERSLGFPKSQGSGSLL